jgi:hypothetical protein
VAHPDTRRTAARRPIMVLLTLMLLPFSRK